MADCPEFRGALDEALQTLHVQLDSQTLERLERFRQGGGYYGFDPVEGWPNRPYYGE